VMIIAMVIPALDAELLEKILDHCDPQGGES